MNRVRRLLRLGIRHPALASAPTLKHVMRAAGPCVEDRPGWFGKMTALLAAKLHVLGLFMGCIKAVGVLKTS
jgi:hypothetical protein